MSITAPRGVCVTGIAPNLRHSRQRGREGAMPPIKLKNMDMRVYPPPLLEGAPPIVTAPDAPRTSPRLLLWAGVLACIVAGAWLCGVGNRWQTPGTPICAGAWVLLCLAAVVRAWKGTQ
jgi:hypothetical protein